jgi:hypothetical protein
MSTFTSHKTQKKKYVFYLFPAQVLQACFPSWKWQAIDGGWHIGHMMHVQVHQADPRVGKIFLL